MTNQVKLSSQKKSVGQSLFPMWAIAAIVAMIFGSFLHLMWFFSENRSTTIEPNDFIEESLSDISFVVTDESPPAGNYEYIGYPAARYANGTILYSAMGPEDCPPVVENVEFLRSSTLLITPKHYDETVECSGDIIAIVERISREDGEKIDRSHVQTIVINSNIPERMLWEEQENSIHDRDHGTIVPEEDSKDDN